LAAAKADKTYPFLKRPFTRYKKNSKITYGAILSWSSDLIKYPIKLGGSGAWRVIDMRIMKAPLFSILALLILSASSFAQEKVQPSGSFILITNPAGATVYLNGDHSLIANTPAQLPANLAGKYQTKIVRAGYESWKGELNFIAGSPNSINISLTRKTRLKAGIRSLLLPGWGQFYSGNILRGGMVTLSAAAAAVGLYYADKKYQDKRADFDIASTAYANATSIDERIRLKTVKDATQRVAYKAETDRRTVFYIGLGIWAYNIIDAVIFFPDFGSVSPAVSAIDGGAKLSIVARF
jgi:hypothetical protein